MSDRGWVSAHVFYSGDLDTLLAEAIRPLVVELVDGALLRGYFFLRYWEGGPHLRLRLRPAAGGMRERVREVVAASCERYLRQRPATTPMTPAQYASVAPQLARLERLTSYADELYPDNSVHFIGYRAEHDRYGTGACLDAVEQHFMESSQIALALVSAGTAATAATARQTAGFCAVMLARLLCPPGVFAAPGTPGDVVPPGRGARAEDYARQRERLHGLGQAMREVAAEVPAEPPAGTASGGLRAWRDSVTTLRDALAGHADAARTAQIVDTCVHLFCNRLGISIPEEGHLRYLVARMAADLHAKE
jgi:thiopeptide-type bacteriocin biosynthesis protein